MPERLRTDRRQEMEAAVLAYLRQNGPQPISEIRLALDAVMSVHLVDRTVRELVAAGRLASRKVLFHRRAAGSSSPVTYPYKAAIYEAVEAEASLEGLDRRAVEGGGRAGGAGPGAHEARPKSARAGRGRPAPGAGFDDRRAELASLVLGYLAEQGPRPLSDIRRALAEAAPESHVDRIVRELASQDRLSTRKADLATEAERAGRTRRLRYRATLFGVAGPGGRIIEGRVPGAVDGPARGSPPPRPALEIGEDVWLVVVALRLDRERQGLSRPAAAALAGISAKYLLALETGKVPNPTVGTLRAYAEALGMRLVLGIEKGDVET